MGILETCMRRWEILALLVVLSIGISIAANGGATVQNNSSSNVATDMTGKISILNVNYSAEDQWVEISNNGTFDNSFTGWKLMNKENATYTFPATFVLKPRSEVKVHSMIGKPNSTDLYNSSVLFNETGDAAILKDATGKTVSKYFYPAISPGAPKATKNATKSNVTAIPKEAVYKANNTKTIISNVTTKTVKDITKVTIVK